MNKTVNINLAGSFFHIDEDAYQQLQHYLEAIKRSFINTPGKEEIISDIEARIAELFLEKMKTERQVISARDVEEVIAIMGQPEDYMLDDEIFDDESVPDNKKTKASKTLFRDTDHSYIAGVSSGLGHYLGIDAVWVRLLWILLTLGSSGAFILIYIALWIFVPEARTTADKLAMRGEPVNISNIERKIKEGFDDVSGKVKNINYEKYGYRAKAGAGSAATAVGKIVRLLLAVFVKFIGIMLLLIAGSTLIALFIGLFTIGTFGIIDAPWTDYFEVVASGNALWVISLLSFFAIGIPFFFLFILGLKILVKNLKSVGKTAKLVLLGLWIISILGLIFFGIKQATERAYHGEVVNTETIPITENDTLYLDMQENSNSSFSYHNSGMKISYDENDQKMLFSSDIELIVHSTRDSVARMEIIKSAEGKNYEDARINAQNINYNTSFSNNELYLNNYLTTDIENKFRDQEVEIRLYLPIGSILYASENTHSFHGYDILNDADEEQYLLITEDGTECLDCPDESIEGSWDDDSNEEWEAMDSIDEANPEKLPLQEETEATDTLTETF